MNIEKFTKVLLPLILSFMFCVVRATHPDFTGVQAERNQAELLTLYKQYLGMLSGASFDCIDDLKNRLTFDVFQKIIPRLDIELSLDEIRANYDRTGFIQFRRVDRASRTLVIACGNKPFSYSSRFESLVFDEMYSSAHAHPGAITVDPDPKNNPTILAFFGVSPLRACENNSFDKIIIEGTSIPRLLEMEHFISDLTRLLAENGRLYLAYDEGPFRLSLDRLRAFEKAWNDWSYGNGPHPAAEFEERTRVMLPRLFQRMINENGELELLAWFERLIPSANWVHSNMTWEETFAQIKAKAGSHNSVFVVPILRLFGYFPEPFTREESRIIRLASVELNVL